MSHERLHTLDLADNDIGAQCEPHIVQAVEVMPMLKELTFECNLVDDEQGLVHAKLEKCMFMQGCRGRVKRSTCDSWDVWDA